uniref:uncharacterized protein LOC122582539 n=1 Tax=Erigeron canadensis TaxID=72917 RepID=UPI001CB9D7B5|nr:uncharacterized protein LOC122582539 [Erigeron canadensis]
MDEYSAAKTLIKFDNPIPLLRHPIKSKSNDESPFLCFKNPKSFASSYLSCESDIIQQCESGARIACSVTASRNCAPPWWKFSIFPNNSKNNGLSRKQELMEREKCEEREMEQCLDNARLSCRKFAEDKCLPAFRDARVVVENGGDVKKSVVGLIGKVCFGEKSSVGCYELGISSWSEIRSRIGVVRIVRGSDLLDKEFR